MRNTGTIARLLQITITASILAFSAGCRKPDAQPTTASSPAVPTDQQISADITSRLNAETALSGQNIQLSVENGRATLSGTVTDEASRALAANDAAAVNGVRTVINNLTVQPVKTTAAAASTPAPATVRRAAAPKQAASMAPPPPPVQQPMQQREPEPVKVVPPPAPPKPVVRTVTIPAGTTIPVRMIDALETGKTQSNTPFHATLAADLVADGVTAIPRGSNVLGRVVDAKDATHYTGSSMLTIELTQISAQGQTFHVVTDAYSAQGKARGSNTAKKVGGGAAIGAVIGALAGGGKGAAIGAAAGGGLGAGANTVTKGEQVQIPSETLVNFRLQNPVSVTTTTQPRQTRSYDSEEAPQQQDPTLQQRQ
jgi:hypothetical protein